MSLPFCPARSQIYLHRALSIDCFKTAHICICPYQKQKEEGMAPNDRSFPFIREPSQVPTKPPSNYCHICTRTNVSVGPLTPCVNFASGACRKVTCMPCAFKHGLPVPAPSEPCPHCTDSCPRTAQCKMYERANFRRRAKTQAKRSEKLAAQRAAGVKTPPEQEARSRAGKPLYGCCAPRFMARQGAEKARAKAVTPPCDPVPAFPDEFLDEMLGKSESFVVEGIRCSSQREADAIEFALLALKASQSSMP